MNNKFSLVFLCLGVISFGAAVYLFFQRYVPLPVPAVTVQTSVEAAESKFAFPIGLSISEAGINLQVFPAQLRGIDWEYTSKGVSYLVSTPIPGRPGNSVFYGHNWPNLLGRLNKARVGQDISILYTDGSQKNFKIADVKTVNADDITILEPTADTRLTLYTCTGFMDRERLVVIAKI